MEATGNGQLQQLMLRNNITSETYQTNADGIFIYIGARPYTDWITENVIKNDNDFIKTRKKLN